MPELSIDYSFARPSPAAIRAAGYAGVWRYLSGGTPGKDLTASEAAALHRAGLGIGLIWETTGNRSLSGAVAGAADGIEATAQAIRLGAPHGVPVLANVGDFAATEGQLDAIMAYYHAFRQAAGIWQGGGYATGFIINGLVSRGAQGLWWQNAMDDAGMKGSAVSPHASIYQRVRATLTIAGTRPGDYDENVAAGAPAVAWWKPGSQPPAPPAVPVSTLEKIMTAVPVVGPGSRNTAMVRRVQGLLVAGAYMGPITGVRTSAIDGVYGPATTAAVKRAQVSFGLAQDGVVGPATWPVLIAGVKL